MTGEYRGWRDVVSFLRRTTRETDGTYRSELRWAVADDERGVALYTARGVRKDRSSEVDIALLCEFRDGRIARATAVPVDVAAFDAFWSG
jgi:ketosteroid isomerase-like protein